MKVDASMMSHGHDRSGLKDGLSLLLQNQNRDRARHSWLTGIKSVDAQVKTTFSSGRVIGLARRADHIETQGLSSHLVATHLTTVPSPAQTVFVVSPPSAQTMLLVAGLLDQKLQALPAQSRPDPTALLSRVQLFQYLSLAGLIESIGDVSTALHESTSNDATMQRSPEPAVLLLQGLSGALADTNRRSGSTQTAALATNIFRSLTHLSRNYAHLLVLVDLDLESRSGGSSADGGQAANHGGPPASGARRTNDATSLSSAFTSQHGHILSLLPSASPISSALDHGVDTIVAVHDAFGITRAHDQEQAKKGVNRSKTAVVEVVKDRMGDKMGEWCLWIQ